MPRPASTPAAYLLGRLNEKHLKNFRRELAAEPGLSSYPHPWLMPDFWEFPTVSMGLGPIMAIYQARFNHYLVDRGIKPDASASRVWAFLGDGECDEPEALGAITLAAREQLDNLIFVVNCNLQRLDGPVRGNGKIIQELEGAFRGAGWNVIKVIWGSEWDPLLARGYRRPVGAPHGRGGRRRVPKISRQPRQLHPQALLRRRSAAGGDGRRSQRRSASPARPRRSRPGESLCGLQGGHRAQRRADRHPCQDRSRATAWAKQAKAATSRTSKRSSTRTSWSSFAAASTFRFPTNMARHAEFYMPPEDSSGDALPSRAAQGAGRLRARPPGARRSSSSRRSGKTTPSSSPAATDARCRPRWPSCGCWPGCCATSRSAGYIVPIVPDEARTFGMEALFRQFGIYSHTGQLYEPVDSDTVLYYREAKDGQILEEGITEAGSMSSFIAAGSSHSSHGISMIPFFIYYSMFGFQRIGDLLWAAGDMRCRGFVLGGTAGRTTLAGEGLQHQDGNSHLNALAFPNCQAYDPCYAYEMAVIVLDGLRRMYYEEEDIYYYITLMNENYDMPILPMGSTEGICRGIYRLSSRDLGPKKPKVQLFGSGAILRESLRARTCWKSISASAAMFTA